MVSAGGQITSQLLNGGHGSSEETTNPDFTMTQKKISVTSPLSLILVVTTEVVSVT